MSTTLLQLDLRGDSLKVDHSTDLAFVHAHNGGFSFCVSFNRTQCEQMARAFSRAAFLIEQHEDSLPKAAPPMLEAA